MSKTATRKKATGNAPAREGGRIELTDDIIDTVLDQVAGGRSLVKVCEAPGMPNRTAFLRRVAADPALQALYAEAMAARADKYAEETIDIADDGLNDTYIDEQGNVKTDTDVIARSKLRVAARQWYAAKIAPKKYGDKTTTELTGADGGPIKVQSAAALTDDQLAAIAAGKPCN